MHPLLWRLLGPVKWWLRQRTWPRGKGFLLRRVLMPLLPAPPARFPVLLPGNVRICLGYRESLGLTTKLYGGFETTELELARSLIKPGSIVLDVGANIGLWTAYLARASEPNGRVWAFEPLEQNLKRLQQHLAMNRVRNVDVHPMALGLTTGPVRLLIPTDLAFASTVSLPPRRGLVENRVVPMYTLDAIWKQSGSPSVSLAKIDVEGGELAVLAGAKLLLNACRPSLIIEAPTQDQLTAIAAHLEPLGYRFTQPTGFMPWNYLFGSSKDLADDS
jgi:FkbM family methyltransferase